MLPSEVDPATSRALMLALGAYLAPDQARHAASLWRGPASGQGSVMSGLSRYCRAVAQQFGLQGKEAEMHLSIIRAMRAQGIGRAQAAEPPQTARIEPGLSANDSVPPGISAVAVQRFVEAVEQCVAREAPDTYSPQRWRQSLLVHARRIPPVLLQQAADWLWGRSPQLTGDWPARGAGTRLINTAYVTLAEWLGPVRADACFTAIVREFENSQDPLLAGVRRYL
ncbi:MAG TPA: hypothetical protein VFW84_08645 [Aquabacterium sp.]|uniref:hypothetical protein n=1 Tax=Aquabacterium sp. TaxID=1872578 RepID=UPI002DA297D6|nr:hypothetical protein [Aquabacterium sp.]HET6789319.1 hypothetical protein [Aquabacterium sp.]HEX5372790.1 hypothetical protein [Aquabacterium sp.]